MSVAVENNRVENPPNWHPEEVMDWHGWGSPVGLSILLVSIGLTAVLLRHAVFG